MECPQGAALPKAQERSITAVKENHPVVRKILKVKRRNICANASCSATDKLVIAPQYACEYLGLNVSKNCTVKICEACLQRAENYQSSLVAMLKKGSFLCNATRITDGSIVDTRKIEDVIDSDEGEEILEEDRDVYTTDIDVKAFTEEMMKKFSLDCQIQDSVNTLEERYKSLTEKFEQFDIIERNIVNSVNEMARDIKIIENELERKPKLIIRRLASPPKRSPSPVKVPDRPLAGRVLHVVEKVSRPAVSLPPSQPFVYEELNVGDPIFIMRVNLLSPWEKGKVTAIKDKGTEKLYTVRFNHHSLKSKTVVLKHLAYGTPSPVLLSVGARVVAQYMEERDQDRVPSSYYAGVISEPPTTLNNYRYLVFFDDGYAQYCTHRQIVMVCQPFNDVPQEIHQVSRSFITSYLQQYPERAMVRLHPGQILKTEWDGQWYASRVEQVDASLAQIMFLIDKRKEWIYRGSTRLQPLYETLANAEARKNQGAKRPTHNISTMRKNAPFVEYTRNVGESTEQSQAEGQEQVVRAVARKSTSKQRPQPTVPPSKTDDWQQGVEHKGRLKDLVHENPHLVRFVPHQCGPACLEKFPYEEGALKGTNPLMIPLKLGWSRIISKQKNSGKRIVFYQAPCGRRLRDMAEMHRFLRLAGSQLGVDLFCFESYVHCFREFEPLEMLNKIKDITYGKENVVVSCVNSIDRSQPDYVEYSKERIPRDGVKLNVDPNFLVCCDCTDDCRDKTKCACWKLTIQATEWGPSRKINRNVGYQHRRLLDGVVTGIYECNSRCSCKNTCLNRVAQRPLQLRLQVFKTERRGWGIRCLDDIPKGTFICVYAGQILTDEGANQDGQAYGDEYLAELDHIEVMERMKEGYESDVDEDLTAAASAAADDNQTSEGEAESVANSEAEMSSKASAVSEKSTIAAIGSSAPSATTKKVPLRSLRAYYGKGENCFIMDAKSTGNIGRYLNHSCCPNVFVQNVFIDSQDLRFPWVAFFAATYIRAGKELTWDYSYDVGSVPGKVLYCQCGTKQCRGRLL